MRKQIAGIFNYIEKNDGWEDSFKVVDDDGLPFVLRDLKIFEGQEVIITIETRLCSNISTISG